MRDYGFVIPGNVNDRVPFSAGARAPQGLVLSGAAASVQAARWHSLARQAALRVSYSCLVQRTGCMSNLVVLRSDFASVDALSKAAP